MSIEISADKRITYLQKRINELEAILNDDAVDFSRVGTVLHQLQGSSPTFGFNELVDHVNRVQSAIRRTPESGEIKSMLKELVVQLDLSKRTATQPIYI